ncbi:MAG: 16S rRNA (uracil(1498)-N(3))-methyltransferase [Luminiphilus sp.]|nr:16S rRNA (uracil(1498)-N(3))-methyltransferase [Luminiphilus sp.]
MNIVLFESTEVSSDHIVSLSGRRHKHVRDVLQRAEGDSVRVGMIDGAKGVGQILAMDEATLALRVELKEAPLPCHPATLVLALPRPKMLRRTLRSCAEFGLQNIHIIQSYRVEKSYWQSPLLKPQKIREALLAGLERSGDTRLPVVTLHRRFKPFVEDQLSGIAGKNPIFLAHLGDFPPLDASLTGPQLIMIGPEGGFIPYEVDLACRSGAQPRSLGPRILSVDTTVPAVLGRTLAL